jgi:homoserine kinase
VAETKRSVLINGFDKLKKTALECGALGAGISGSGPSVYALCRGRDSAVAVMKGMSGAMKSLGIRFDAYMSSVNRSGTQVC